MAKKKGQENLKSSEEILREREIAYLRSKLHEMAAHFEKHPEFIKTPESRGKLPVMYTGRTESNRRRH